MCKKRGIGKKQQQLIAKVWGRRKLQMRTELEFFFSKTAGI